ncbi:MAG: hypothetical protein DRP54_06805 [Spirochaetes bacterium]|nr:MAG: hypothetical protein DRP54_06805 [Spirochaetota bacterium]
MRAKAVVNAGVCGYGAVIIAEAKDAMGKALVSLDTECNNLKELGQNLEIEIMDVVQKGCSSEIFTQITQLVPNMHCPCPVILGIFEAVKIAAGLALPKDISIRLEKIT